MKLALALFLAAVTSCDATKKADEKLTRRQKYEAYLKLGISSMSTQKEKTRGEKKKKPFSGKNLIKSGSARPAASVGDSLDDTHMVYEQYYSANNCEAGTEMEALFYTAASDVQIGPTNTCRTFSDGEDDTPATDYTLTCNSTHVVMSSFNPGVACSGSPIKTEVVTDDLVDGKMCIVPDDLYSYSFESPLGHVQAKSEAIICVPGHDAITHSGVDVIETAYMVPEYYSMNYDDDLAVHYGGTCRDYPLSGYVGGFSKYFGKCQVNQDDDFTCDGTAACSWRASVCETEAKTIGIYEYTTEDCSGKPLSYFPMDITSNQGWESPDGVTGNGCLANYQATYACV